MASASTAKKEEELDPTEKRQKLLETGRLEVFRFEDDEIAMRAASNNSRLPYARLTAAEMECFPDVMEGRATLNLYLYVRNKLLQFWDQEPNVELTVEDANANMPVPYNSDTVMIKRIHGYLQRQGYINYGVFHKLRASPQLLGSKKKKIIVIGAGAAGIAAARQLIFFGFDVVVLEARKRVGGRMHTFHGSSPHTFVTDLGASVVTGVEGNPMMTLMKQVQSAPVKLKTTCPIYDENGKLVDRRKDKLIEEAFKKLAETCAYITRTMGVTELDGEEMDLQKCIDKIISLRELSMQDRRREFWESNQALVKKTETLLREINLCASLIESLQARIVADREGAEPNSTSVFPDENGPPSEMEVQLMRESRLRDLLEAFKHFDEKKEKLRCMEATLREMKKKEPSEVWMNPRDRSILDFHLANLELAAGTELRNLSARYWDDDAGHEMSGSHLTAQRKAAISATMHLDEDAISGHLTVRDGYGDLMAKVFLDCAKHLQYDAVVKKIQYDEKGVSVEYEQGTEQHVETGDAVVCTIPLGVLKKSVAGDKSANSAPEFEPPLPAEHVTAIEKLGFGNFNKLVLIFERAFWSAEHNLFGRLNQHTTARGEMFLFVCSDHSPILHVLMAGASANPHPDNKVLVRAAMVVLQGIFGTGIPKAPAEAIITRWHKDPFSLGCYSYIAKGATGAEHDTLAKTVHLEGRPEEARIFFAGEHTSRKWPGSVQGAWLSGMREAAKIADHFLGKPFARGGAFEQPECVDLDLDSDEEEEAKTQGQDQEMRGSPSAEPDTMNGGEQTATDNSMSDEGLSQNGVESMDAEDDDVIPIEAEGVVPTNGI